MLDVLSSQPLLSNIITHLLTFIVVFLSVVLLHDMLVRSKQLNASSWSLMLSTLGRDHPQSPPGPWWNLPVLGYLPWLGSKPYVTLWNLSRRYGSVCQIRVGSLKVVVLNGQKTIRDALVQQGDTFAGRPAFPSFAAFCQGRSMAFGSMHDEWIVQRKVYANSRNCFESVGGDGKKVTEPLTQGGSLQHHHNHHYHHRSID